MQIQSADTTHHVVAVGVFFGLISLNLVGDISKQIRDYPHLEIFFTSEIIFQFFWGNIGVYVQEALWKSLVSTNYISSQKSEYISLLKNR